MRNRSEQDCFGVFTESFDAYDSFNRFEHLIASDCQFTVLAQPRAHAGFAHFAPFVLRILRRRSNVHIGTNSEWLQNFARDHSTGSRSRGTRAEFVGYVGACRAIGARVRWLYRLGAVSTTRLTSFSFGGGAKAAGNTCCSASLGRPSRASGRETTAPTAAAVEVAGTSHSGSETRERHEAFAWRILRSWCWVVAGSGVRTRNAAK